MGLQCSWVRWLRLTPRAIPACITLCLCSQGDANSFRVNKVISFFFLAQPLSKLLKTLFFVLCLAAACGEWGKLRLCWKRCTKSMRGNSRRGEVTEGSAAAPAWRDSQEVLVAGFSFIHTSAGVSIFCVDTQESRASAESLASPFSSSLPPSTPFSVSRTILR